MTQAPTSAASTEVLENRIVATGIKSLLDWLGSFLGLSVAPDSNAGYILAALIHIFLLLNLVAVGALVFIWLERKVSGRIQDRLGPTRVGGRFGWLQTLADGIKLLTKEDLMPEGADKFLFKLAPYVSFCASLSAFMAIPFAGGTHPFVALHLNVAVFFIIAVLGLEVFGVILAGYASASKWSLFGAMREAAQVVSYEVPLGMCAVVPVLIAGSMDLVHIGDRQAGGFWNWYIFHDPFTFITFWVYFTCATASVNRAPFDLAEAESELVAGFHTEYSGLRWSFFFMAEYGSMMAVSLLASILFLGGWHGPFPIAGPIAGATAKTIGWIVGIFGSSIDQGTWTLILGNVLGTLNIIFKGVVGVTVMMWVRWTLPRLRIDQVITTCLKYCVPIAALAFLGATWWQYMLPNRMFFGAVGMSPAAYQLGELLPTNSVRNERPATEGSPSEDQSAATTFALTE
jgi:NADH-quinone oxidoreductase subunit H